MITVESLNSNNIQPVRDIYTHSLENNKDGFVQNRAFHGDIIDQANAMLENRGLFFVARYKNTIVGFGALKRERGSSKNSYELCKLHISQSHTGRGYGQALSKHLITCAKKNGAQQINLHVTKTQIPAISLYKKLGFIITKEHVYEIDIKGKKHFFDTLFMTLTL